MGSLFSTGPGDAVRVTSFKGLTFDVPDDAPTELVKMLHAFASGEEYELPEGML